MCFINKLAVSFLIYMLSLIWIHLLWARQVPRNKLGVGEGALTGAYPGNTFLKRAGPQENMPDNFIFSLSNLIYSFYKGERERKNDFWLVLDCSTVQINHRLSLGCLTLAHPTDGCLTLWPAQPHPEMFKTDLEACVPEWSYNGEQPQLSHDGHITGMRK